MVRGVKPEVSSEDVVGAVHDVVGGLVGILGVETGVVTVRVPAGDDIARHHGDRKYAHRVERIPNKCPPEERKDNKAHTKEAQLVARVPEGDADSTQVAGQSNDDGVFQLTHRRSVTPLPG